MTSKARLPGVEAGLQAMVEVHQVAVGGHQVEVLLVAVMVLQQVVQGPPSRPTEEAPLGVVMVALLGVVEVRWDQVPLRRMQRWLRASARKRDITGRMLLRNIQVGNLVKSTSIVLKH